MKKAKNTHIPIILGIAAVAVAAVVLMSISIFASVEADYEPTIFSTTDGTTINLLDGNIYLFASNYSKGGSEGLYDWLDCYAPIPATVSWTASGDALYYTVKLSRSSNMSDATTYLSYGTDLNIENLFMGQQYYYQIIAKYDDHTVKSDIFDFKTAYLPRTVVIDGVSNTRDIGGYTTDSGKRVKQGMLYRGGTPVNVTEAGIDTAVNTFGIKTQIDLSGGETSTSSAFGSTVEFHSVSAPWYASGSNGITDSTKQAQLSEVFKLLADEDNYPVYFHCSLGRDRTGTLAFLINGLLGVGENDLFMDYETAFFSWTGCEDGGKPSSKVQGDLQSLYDYLKSYGSGTLSENIEAYLLNIGLSLSEINSIKTILLEEVSE